LSTQSFRKRERERSRQERARNKEQRRQERRNEKSDRPPAPDGVDPDIAGIVPGPQPRDEDD
jgi:hypothetical protein